LRKKGYPKEGRKTEEGKMGDSLEREKREKNDSTSRGGEKRRSN